MGRTNGHTLTAQAALVRVDIRTVVADGNSTERALLLALATTNAADLAGLHGNGAFVLADAGDVHSPTLRPLLAQLDDATRTSLHTGTAGHTPLFVDFGNARLRIDVNGIKLAGLYAVATA